MGGKIPYFQIDNSLVYQFWFILGYIAMIYRKYLNILFSILIIVVLGFIERASLLYALLGIYAIYLLSLRLTYLTRFTLYYPLGLQQNLREFNKQVQNYEMFL